MSELLAAQEQARQSVRAVESTLLSHKKRIEAMDTSRYLLLEDFAVFTQAKLPDLLLDTKVQVVEEINQQLEERQSSDAREQEARHDALQREVQGKLAQVMDSVSGAVGASVSLLKDEMKAELQREIQEREASMTGKLEKSKQEFLKAVNGNMKVLDNLIGDYTAKTRDRIGKQLQFSTGQETNGSVQRGQSPESADNQGPEDDRDADAAHSCQSCSEVRPVTNSEVSSQLVSTNRDHYRSNHYFNQEPHTERQNYAPRESRESIPVPMSQRSLIKMHDHYGTPNKNADDEYQNSPLQPAVQVLPGSSADQFGQQLTESEHGESGREESKSLHQEGIQEDSGLLRRDLSKAEMLRTQPA